MQFEWDAAKAALNLRKHGVSFEEAETVFLDPNLLQQPDVSHSVREERTVSLGISAKLRLLLVVHTERDENVIRVISARKATKKEAEQYAQSQA